MGHVLLHTYLGIAEVALLSVDFVHGGLQLVNNLLSDGHELLSVDDGGVVSQLLVSNPQFALFVHLLHQQTLVPEVVGILLIIASKLGLYVVEEGGQRLFVNVLGIVFQQGGHHFAVEGGIPGVGIVAGHYHQLLALLHGLGIFLYALANVEGTCGELVGATEGFVEEHEVFHHLFTVGVQLAQVLDVELAFEVARRVLILLYASLVSLLHLHDAYRVDTLVHTDRVLPVVRALCILRVVLDTHGLAGTHVAQHNGLFYAAHLSTGSILCVAHLFNAIA